MHRPRTIFGPLAAAAASLAVFGAALTEWRVRPEPAAAEALQSARHARKGHEVTNAARGSLQARLIVPVGGVTRDHLTDSWGQARSEGRAHQGIDITAPRGASVLAATDGRIVKFFESDRGGVTIYQFDRAERFVYYYAHLDARAAGLAEGDTVRQGQTIGFVGSSGNASTPHLHFEIQRLTPERRWWVAEALNPYPLLMSGQPPS